MVGKLSDFVALLQAGACRLHLNLSGTCQSFADLTKSKSATNILLYAFLGSKEQGSTELRSKKLEFENEDSDFANDNSDNEEERKLADKVDNEDVRFMMPEHMPSYLRIDKDI